MGFDELVFKFGSDGSTRGPGALLLPSRPCSDPVSCASSSFTVLASPSPLVVSPHFTG
jgi:hypothetical protein